ncbi:hypothetical protein MACJ_001404 [Theileria orientalis]|uniref:C2 domain-containing protein n=1 Tax=Theileria orientalis TaxID=68886 RepID=A0A976M854_THEOR|nr:hypothetical protein MACJ_001404 [Theileria orientalis]
MGSTRYYIKVDIHEVKDVIFKEPDTEAEIIPNLQIETAIGSLKRETQKKSGSSNAIFNTSMNFSPDLTKADFERARIIVTLYHRYTFSSGVIGHHAFSLPLIYSKQQHCILRSWVRVFNPAFPTHNAGSLLVSVFVSAPGDNTASYKEAEELAGQSLGNDQSQTGIRFSKVPEMNMKSYMLYLNVVCGRDFKPQGGILSSIIEPYVKVSHFGMSEQTQAISGSRDPEWQTTLYLPCITPSYDEMITIEVWNGQSNGTLLHYETIDLIHLINNEYPPRWINIYCQPNTSDVLKVVRSYVGGAVSSLTDYGGRILVSASAEQVQTLYVKGIKPCRSIMVPPIQQRVIAVELYEIVGQKDVPNIVKVAVTHGPFSTKSENYQRNRNMSYMVDDKSGRLTPIEPIFSSNDDSDVWDLFVYVYDMSNYGMDNRERIAWERIPYERAKMSEGRPMWVYLNSFEQAQTIKFNILMSFDISSNVINYVRKERLKYDLTHYVFRSMLYEALHLPCTGNGQYPNSCVEIELSSYRIKSRPVKRSINPYFFESHELEVQLPSNLLLAPDININVYAVSSFGASYNQLMCTGQYSLSKVPKSWNKAPQWLKLKSTINSFHRPKILMAFELIQFEEYRRNPDNFKFFDDIFPSTIHSTLSLLLIGIRTFLPLQNPKVNIMFKDYDTVMGNEKRQGHSSDSQDQVGTTGKALSGCYGNWNYLTSHEIEVDLPKRMQHHACLEFQITSSDMSGFFGTTILTLNQFLPWLSEEERNTSVELFKMQCVDDFNSAGQSQNEVAATEKKTEEVKNINVQMLDKIDLVSLHKSKFSQENGYQSDHVSSSASTNDGYTPSEANAEGEPDSKPKEEIKEEVDEDMDFEILIDDSTNEVVRDELPYEMESEFDSEDLPYMKAPIVKFTPSGIPEVIGTLKFILYITETSKKSSTRTNKELAAIRERINTQKKLLNELYSQAKDLVVRTYVLEAKGLYSSSIASSSSGDLLSNLTGDVMTYVWIRNVDQEQYDQGSNNYSYTSKAMGYPNSIRDANNAKKGLKPIYNNCYNVSCSLPENSILKISIVSKGTITEEIIGTTYIDCEDRFFNKNLQQLMLEDCAPVESRTLKTYGNAGDPGEITISHGILRLWLEMMDLQTAKMKPIQHLGSLEPTNYELRVVIWKAHYFSDENSTVSLFVRGIYQNEQSDNSQDTEVHYHSKDKTGIFNWRLKYPISIPTEYTGFKLQLYSYNKLSSNEVLGEANVDLGFEFHKVRKKNSIHAIPKFTVNVYSLHNSSKVVGSVDVEISILNESDSKRYLVGSGRDPPNRDPFLPAVLENRSWVDIDGITDTIKNASKKLISGVKYTSIGILVAGALAFILIMVIILR